MIQAYEGFLEKGLFYPIGQQLNIQGRRRAIITILDEPIGEKPDTWAELDRIILEMSEKPRVEDFPRRQLERDIINFKEV